MTNEQDARDQEPFELVKVCGPTEAQMIEEMLKNNGIECTLEGNVTSSPFPATSGLDEVHVLVKLEDAAKAQELVDAFFTPVGKDELEEAEPELGVEDPDEPGGFTV